MSQGSSISITKMSNCSKEKLCKQVPCHTFKRINCENKQCKKVSTVHCEMVPTVIEKASCNVVIKNVCRDEIIIKPLEKLNRVREVPEKICANNKVKRLRLLLK